MEFELIVLVETGLISSVSKTDDVPGSAGSAENNTVRHTCYLHEPTLLLCGKQGSKGAMEQAGKASSREGVRTWQE